MTKILFLSLVTLLFTFHLNADELCSIHQGRLKIQEITESDDGVGVVFYGAFMKGDSLLIEDMEKDNQYTVKNSEALLFSAHGEYYSGYFILVYELSPSTCEVLSEYEIYSE